MIQPNGLPHRSYKKSILFFNPFCCVEYVAAGCRERESGAVPDDPAPDQFRRDSTDDTAADAARPKSRPAVVQTAGLQYAHNRNRSDKTGIQPVSVGKTAGIDGSVPPRGTSIRFSPLRRRFHPSPDAAQSAPGQIVTQFCGRNAHNRRQCHNHQIQPGRKHRLCLPVSLPYNAPGTVPLNRPSYFLANGYSQPVIPAPCLSDINHNIGGNEFFSTPVQL